MEALPPWLLRAACSVLRAPAVRRRSPSAVRLLARARLPHLASDRFAVRTPSVRPATIHPISPLVIALPPDDVVQEGPLAGERVVVKDSVDVAGVRTGLGLLDGGPRADRDAVIVERLRLAGAHIAGKTKMTELGMDGLGAMMPHPVPDNPRAPGYFAGGSSTGTAVAVASGLARYGVGGDGLGSVRIPSAYCGLVGLKPGHERLPHAGYRSPAPSMDVPGPMADSVADCARLFQVLAGEAVQPLDSAIPERIGIVEGLGPELACASVASAFERVLRTLGAKTRTVRIEGAPLNAMLAAAAAAAEVTRSPLSRRRLTPAGQLTVMVGQAIFEAYANGRDEVFLEERSALRARTLRALEEVDVICFPTTAIPAPAMRGDLLGGGQDGLLIRAVGTYTPLANLTGLPAIAVPSGVDARGRPLSFMMMGRDGSEATLLRYALAIEESGLGTRPVLA